MRAVVSRQKGSDPISREVLNFHARLVADPHHRFRSWEHCYRFFQSGPRDYDLASLHLAFYLASWGMYRGSSFLLQKDYRIHRAVVEEILNPRYRLLNNLSLDHFAGGRREVMDALFALLEWIKSWYRTNTSTPRSAANVTDTLATKILLGTLGCTPAYDRYFITGLKKHGLPFSYLNKKNFSEMMTFCLEHREEFRKAQSAVSAFGLAYPIMKVIDMYFWRLGEEQVPGEELAE
jgi:hypothetical protein